MGDTQVKYTLSLNDLLTQRLQQADAQANRFETTMNGLQGTLNRVGAAVGVAFGIQAVKQFVGSVIEAGSQVENAQIGLGTLLKNNEEAAKVIQDTMNDATKTPFAFEGLLQANKALISAGSSAKEARRTVLDLANAISATGGGDVELQRMVVNLQQIKNTGKATALDIKQFAYAGINIYKILADATNLPISKVKDLDVSYDMLRYALAKAHEQGGAYAQGLEKMANSTSVGISNLGDALFQLKVRIFNDAKPAVSDLIATGMDMIKWLGDAYEWVKRNREMLLGLAKGVLLGVGAFKLYKLALQSAVLWQKIEYASITLLGEGFLTANAATKLLAGSFQLLKESVLSNPFGLALTAIAALTTAYFAFSGAAKDAKRENDKLNLSLQDTVKIASDKTEDLIFQIADKYKYGIKAFDKSGNAIRYSVKEQNALIAKDINDQINMIVDNTEKVNGMANLGFVEMAQINKLKQYRSVLAKGPKKLDEAGSDMVPKPEIKTHETSKVTGNRVTTINIHINNLVKEFTVKTVHFNESPEKAKEIVTQALLSAVNDSQVVAGQ
jgi:tape measure domain-containing protein